jgi:hypothetical protein
MNEALSTCPATQLEQITVACDIQFLQWILSGIPGAQLELRSAIEKAVEQKIACN